jgi:hypothetical protein
MEDPGDGDLYNIEVVEIEEDGEAEPAFIVLYPIVDDDARPPVTAPSGLTAPRAGGPRYDEGGLLTALADLPIGSEVILCCRLNPEDEIERGRCSIIPTDWPLADADWAALYCDVKQAG